MIEWVDWLVVWLEVQWLVVLEDWLVELWEKWLAVQWVVLLEVQWWDEWWVIEWVDW